MKKLGHLYYVLMMFFILSFSNIIHAQYPLDEIMLHPYLQIDRIGNCFTSDNTGAIYFGMRSNKIYKLSSYSSSGVFNSITIKDIDPGVSFKSGVLHKNGNNFIVGNSYGSQIVICDSIGNKVEHFDLSSDGVQAILNYRITSDNSSSTEYFFGTADNDDNNGIIIRLCYYKKYPQYSYCSVKKFPDPNLTHLPSIVNIGNTLFISTNDGRIIKWNKSSPTSSRTIIDSGNDSYIRHIATDDSRIFAILENSCNGSGYDDSFWVITNPLSATPTQTLELLGNDNQLQPIGVRMYVDKVNGQIYMYAIRNSQPFLRDGLIYNITTGVWTINNPSYNYFDAGFEILGDYQYSGNHYILAYDLYNDNITYKQFDRKSIGNFNQNLIQVQDLIIDGEGDPIQTIDYMGNFLYTSMYWSGYLHTFNVNTGTKDFFSARTQADVIKRVSIPNVGDYILYGCYGGMGRAQLRIVRNTGVYFNAGSLPATVDQRCARITSITADNNYVYFGSGEQFSKDDTPNAVVAYDLISNLTKTNPNYDFYISSDTIAFTSGQISALDNPIRFIALAKNGSYLYGITGNREQSDGDRYFTESYLFRVTVPYPYFFEKKKITDKIRKDFASKTLKIVNNYLYVGAGTEIWKYNLSSFNINSPTVYKIGDINKWQEDHILAIEYYDNKFYILLANKVKVYNSSFQQLGTFHTHNNSEAFKDMVLNNSDNNLYVVTSKGYLYKYNPNSYLVYTKVLFIVSGDFDGDGIQDDIAEICSFSSMDKANMLKIRIKSSNGSKPFVDKGVWITRNDFNTDNILYCVSGDFDCDNKIDDIAMICKYGNGTVIHMFLSSGSIFNYSYYCYYSASLLSSNIKHAVFGDFDNNNKKNDIAVFYDNGIENIIYVFRSYFNTSKYRYEFRDPVDYWSENYFNPELVRFALSGDFDNDGKINDIATFYDYNNKTGIHMFCSSGSSFFYDPYWWDDPSNPNNPVPWFNSNLVKYAVAGDFDNDYKINDIATFYDYNGATGIHTFLSDGDEFIYEPYWWNNPDYNSNLVRFACVGDFQFDNWIDDIANYYDENDQTKIHLFISNPSNEEFIYEPYWYNYFIGLAKTLDIYSEYSNRNIPNQFDLAQNFPNPFNPITNIQYDLPKESKVSIIVYNIRGQKVKELINEFKPAGTYQVTFNGSYFASGIYFYRIQAGDFVKTKRMLLIK